MIIDTIRSTMKIFVCTRCTPETAANQDDSTRIEIFYNVDETKLEPGTFSTGFLVHFRKHLARFCPEVKNCTTIKKLRKSIVKKNLQSPEFLSDRCSEPIIVLFQSSPRTDEADRNFATERKRDVRMHQPKLHHFCAAPITIPL